MLSTSKKGTIFILCALVMCIVNLDLTTFNLILATMAHEMNASLMTMQWVASGYIIAAGSMMAFAGRLLDVMGARKVLLLGLLLFAITSAGVALSTHEYELVVCRVLQGASIAFLFPVVLAILRLVFPGKRLGFMLATLVAIGSLSQAFGPMYGAWLVTHYHWRWIFWINVPVSLLCVALLYSAMPKMEGSVGKVSMRLPSVLLLVVCLLVLMHGLNSLHEWGFLSLPFAGCVLVSLISFLWFVRLEKQSTMPILDVRLFESQHFIKVCVIRFVIMFMYFSLLFSLGLLLQNVLHYSALQSGSFLIQMTLVLGVVALFSGKLVDRVGAKKPLFVSLLLLAFGVFGVFSFCWHETFLWLSVSLVVLGLGFAVSIPSSVSAAVLSVKPNQVGATTGVLFTVSFVGASFGIAVSGFMLCHFSESFFRHALIQAQLSVTTAQERILELVASGARNLHWGEHAFDASLMPQLRQVTQSAFMHGFKVSAGLLVVLALVGCYCCARLRLMNAKETEDV